MVQQKAALRFVRVGPEIPRARRLADRIPCPYGARLDGFAVARKAAHLAPLRFDVDPAAVFDALRRRRARIHVQIVLAMYLTQPRILRVPRVIHRHRPLRDGRERILRVIGRVVFERRIPERQRIEILLDARTQMIGRLASLRLALRGEPELLHHVRVERDHDRLVELAKALLDRKVQIRPIAVAHVLHRLGQRVVIDAVVLRVLFPLPRIRLADERLVTVLAAPADQEAHTRARCRLVIDDELRIVAILALAFRRRERGELEAARQFDEHFLERLAFARRRHDGHAHGIDGAVELGNRPVEHRHRVVAFEVRRIGQDQIGERCHLRLERIAHDDERNLVLAVVVFVREHLADFDGIHRRVPRHVGHEDQQRVDRIRIAAPRVRDDAVHQAMHGERIFPRERLVDAHGFAALVDEQVLGRGRPAERTIRERRIGLHVVGTVRRFRRRRHRARIRRLVPEAPRPVDRAEQRHQHGQCAYRLKAVRVRSEPPHCVKGDGRARHGLVRFAPRVGPSDRQRDLVIARDVGHFACKTADRIGGNACDLRRPLRRAIGHLFAQQLERRRDGCAVRERIASFERRPHARRVMQYRALARGVPPHMILRKERIAHVSRFVAHEKTIRVAVGAHVQQFARIRIAFDELAIIRIAFDQLAHQRHEKCAVRAGADRHPLVGNRRIAGANRIDRNEAAARALELRDRDLQWIRVMILGRADHEEQLRTIQIGAAELPERAAHRVDHARRHVRRAEAAMRRIVGRAELLREQARQRLHLVASGEEREFFGVCRPQMGETLFEHVERDVPRDGLELRAAAWRVLLAQQRLREARGRVLLHDARRALRADHALVERMLRIAVDVAHLAIAQMHADAASARAHVAGRRLDFELFVLGASLVLHRCLPVIARWQRREHEDERAMTAAVPVAGFTTLSMLKAPGAK